LEPLAELDAILRDLDGNPDKSRLAWRSSTRRSAPTS